MSELTMYAGTVEYLRATLTADVDLVDQPVEFSFDRVTWSAGEWDGAVGPTRTARLLVGGAGVPMPPKGSRSVFVRLTDFPEIPVMRAGTLIVS